MNTRRTLSISGR